MRCRCRRVVLAGAACRAKRPSSGGSPREGALRAAEQRLAAGGPQGSPDPELVMRTNVTGLKFLTTAEHVRAGARPGGAARGGGPRGGGARGWGGGAPQGSPDPELVMRTNVTGLKFLTTA